MLGSAYIFEYEDNWVVSLSLPEPVVEVDLGPFPTRSTAIAAFGKWANQRGLFTGPITAKRTIPVSR